MNDKTDTFALEIGESIVANTDYVGKYHLGHFENDDFLIRLLFLYTEIISSYKEYRNSKGDEDIRVWIVSYLADSYAFLEIWKMCIVTKHKEALEVEQLHVHLDHFEQFLHSDTNNDLNIVEMIFWTTYAYEFSIKAKEQTEETIKGKDDVHDEMCENYICCVKTGIDLAQIAIIAFVARLGEYPSIDQPIVLK